MGRTHSELMMIQFPNQNATGTDLGNIEIKETTRERQKFTIDKKDLRPGVEYFLMYDWQSMTYWIIDAQDLPPVKRHSDFTVHGISWRAIHTSQDIIQIYEWLIPLLKDPRRYIPEFMFTSKATAHPETTIIAQ